MRQVNIKKIYLMLKLNLIRLIWRVITALVFMLKLEDQITQNRRKYLGQRAHAFYQGKVAYGLFEGLKIHAQSAWSGSMDTGSKILGVYESQVQNWISEKNLRSIMFLDVGASDGYFALGMINSGVAESTIAYELSLKDRNIIKSLSYENNMSAKIQLKGEATPTTIINDLQNIKIKLILIDIEGGEFNLVNKELLFAAQHCFIIIEVHKSEGRYVLDEFKSLCKTFHVLEELNDFERKLPKDNFTENLTDNERVLLLSEGRGYGMTWFALSPKLMK